MSSDRPSVPYVVKYPWYVKLIALLSVGIVVFLLIPNPRPVVLELWEQRNIALRVCMLLCAVMVPAGIAEIFLFRLVLSESGIEVRTKFLRKKVRPYSEVEGVEYRPGTIFQPPFLTITFSDLHTIKLAIGLANLQTVATILDTYGERKLAVIDRREIISASANWTRPWRLPNPASAPPCSDPLSDWTNTNSARPGVYRSQPTYGR